MFNYFVTKKRHVFEKKRFTKLEWAAICYTFEIDPKIVDKIVINPQGAILCGNFNEGDTYDG